MIIIITTIALMLILAFEDFRSREVSVIWIGAFYLLILFEIVTSKIWNFENTLINIAIFFCLGFTVFIYSLIRWGARKKIINRTIGLGDLLLTLGFIFIFSPINFLLFLNSSFIIGLVFYFMSKKRIVKIPLAGINAAIYSVLLISSIANIDYSILFQLDILNSV